MDSSGILADLGLLADAFSDFPVSVRIVPSASVAEKVTIDLAGIADEQERRRILLDLLVGEYGTLADASRELDYEASRPEMHLRLADYELRERCKVGVIRSAKLEFSDRDWFGVTLSIDLPDGTSFGDFIPIDKLEQMLAESGIKSVESLRGMPCFCEPLEGRSMRFYRPWNVYSAWKPKTD